MFQIQHNKSFVLSIPTVGNGSDYLDAWLEHKAKDMMNTPITNCGAKSHQNNIWGELIN